MGRGMKVAAVDLRSLELGSLYRRCYTRKMYESPRTISVVGLGYVGLTVAVAFGHKGRTIGLDADNVRIQELVSGYDRRMQCSQRELEATDVYFTSDPRYLSHADFHIVAVPTPIDDNRQPDMSFVRQASITLGSYIAPGHIVVYESTVYPGATEEMCIPILEEVSGLKANKDFCVGYSPERLNPGDTINRFENTSKIISGQNAECLEIIASVYETVVTASLHRAPTIRVAETAKVVENVQRDINIALMNELSIIFNQLNIDTFDVLNAAGTKWNFYDAHPGLVGGDCISVDPHLLLYKSFEQGYLPRMISTARQLNDGMGSYLADQAIRYVSSNGNRFEKPIVTLLGITYKEDVPDLRNTQVPKIAQKLMAEGVHVQVHDPIADANEVWKLYGLSLLPLEEVLPADQVIYAVPHSYYLASGWNLMSKLLKANVGSILDVGGVLNREEIPPGIELCRL